MKIRNVLIGLFLAMTVSVPVNASTNLANMEAMFIYNFLRLVNWPVGATGDSFVIGVYGDSETYHELVTFTANRKVGTKSIEIKKIANGTEAKQCQLVFIPKSSSTKISSLRRELGNTSVLLVCETEGSTASGATIEFVIQGDKLKFRINEDRAKQQNLVISKSLIDMAV